MDVTEAEKNGDVLILMSTYNGTAFLAEQLQSIVDQDYTGQITVFIRDDGSSDGTVALAQGMPLPENRRITVAREENIGPQRSFLELIRRAEPSAYYFFADQDDIWKPEKIRVAVEALRQYPDVPACYCSNYDLFHSESGEITPDAIPAEPEFRPLKVIFYNQIPGCVMGFNAPLMALLQKLELEQVMMHDSMALSLCSAVGRVIYDPESRILHRIHGSNVVGEGHKKIVLTKWIPEKLKLLVQKDDFDLSKMAEQFLRFVPEDNPYYEDLRLLRDYKSGFHSTLQMLRHPDSHGPTFDRTTLSIRSKILFHIF